MPERNPVTENNKGAWRAPDRPSIRMYVSFELFNEAQQHALLGKDGVLEPFDPERRCYFRCFVPRRGNPVADYLTKQVGAPVGISCVQHRRPKAGTEDPKDQDGLSPDSGKLRSCALVTEDTPWMRVRGTTEAFEKKVGISFENGERLFARLHPAHYRNGVLEAVIEFNTGARCTISDVAGESGADDTKVRGLYFDPMDEDDHTYFNAVHGLPLDGVVKTLNLLAPPEQLGGELMSVRELYDPDNLQPIPRPRVPRQLEAPAPVPPASEEPPQEKPDNLVHLSGAHRKPL